MVDAGLNPLHPFHRAWSARGPQCPIPFSTPSDYLAANPDVAASGVNALIHYVRSGAAEGRPLRIPHRQGRPHALRHSDRQNRTRCRRNSSCKRRSPASSSVQPVISVVVPVYRVPLPILKAMVESVRIADLRALGTVPRPRRSGRPPGESLAARPRAGRPPHQGRSPRREPRHLRQLQSRPGPGHR